MAGPVVVTIVNKPFKIVQHDLRPYLPFWFFEPDGTTPFDITDAEGVDIVVAPKQAPTAEVVLPAKFRKPCVILDPLTGHGEYRWSDDDTDTSGSWSYQFKLLWPDSEPQTIPVDSYLDLSILDDLT